jgi:lysophospholipase L1-like esterase
VLVATVTISVAMMLLLAEGALRWEHAKYRQRLAYGKKLCITAAPQSELIYVYEPNRCGHNTQGYRDAEHAIGPVPGIFRIVVIGDSVAEGQGVAYEEVFGRLLERLLNSAPQTDSQHYEVIILARSGYSTSQELIILREEAFRYDPNLIVWSYMLNDPAHPVFHDANGERGRYFYRPRSYVVHLLTVAHTRWRDYLSKRECPSEWHAHLHCAYRGQWVASFAEIGRLTAARRVPAVVLIHPVFEQVGFDRYSLTALHEELGREATRAGLDVIDLLQSYRAYHPGELRQRGDDPWHANEFGHALAAEAILRYMQQRGYAESAEESRP